MYQVARRNNKKKLRKLLADHPESLLSLVRLIEDVGTAVGEVFDLVGSAAIKALLDVAAQEIAGRRQQGKKRSSPIGWYGTESGSVRMGERKLRIERPRLRKRGVGAGGEVDLPAYEAMNRESDAAAFIAFCAACGMANSSHCLSPGNSGPPIPVATEVREESRPRKSKVGSLGPTAEAGNSIPHK